MFNSFYIIFPNIVISPFCKKTNKKTKTKKDKKQKQITKTQSFMQPAKSFNKYCKEQFILVDI